jgi:WD40 repeat protein
MDLERVGRVGRNRAASRAFGFGLSGALIVIAVFGCGSSATTYSPTATIAGHPSTPTATPTVTPSSEPASPTAIATPGHGQFTATGSMAVARSSPTAVLLGDGRVLVVGGSGDNTAELYDPGTGAFAETGPMHDVRVSGATANLLPDGRVLVTGGVDNSLGESPIASAELYDPNTGAFVPTGSMAHARSGHTATSLPDGRVLVVGGSDSSEAPLSSAELYDPRTGKFTPTGSMADAAVGHTATLLQDGRVLIVGGTGTGAYNDTTSTTAELYDPKTGEFTLTGSMAARRWSGHTATLLKDGRVLVDGGNASGVQEVPLSSAELYNPKTGTFSKTGSMAEARDGQSATRLLDGRVLLVGGVNSHTAELYDPRAGAFVPTGSTVAIRASQSATLLNDGRVLIAGGAIAGGAINPADDLSAEVYLP